MSQASVGVDFTLETMQYKFATIIGELCGKPSILSQFAVWLDLRLAEYKLKGSISLDCSGQKPSPEWLHGLKDPAKPVNPSYGEVLPESFSRPGSDQNVVQPARSKPFNRQNDRHSKPADFVVVKTEPNEDSRLFGENSHGPRVDRKRHTDSLSYDVFSPTKSRRISATSPRSAVDNSGFFPSQEQTGPNMVDLPTDDFDLMNRGSESSYDRGDNSTDMSYQRGENSDFYLGTGLGDDSVSSESIPLKSFQQQSDADFAMGPVIPPEPRRTSTRQAAEKARMFLSQMVEEENEEKQEEIGSPGEDFEGSTEIEDENELDEEFPFDEDENAEAEVAKEPIKGKENDKMPQGGEGSVIPTELNADNTSAKTDSAVDVDPEEAQRDTIGSDVNIPVASDTIPEHNTGGVREEEGSNNEPVGCSVADSTYSGSKPKRLTQLAECEQGLTKPSIEQVFGKPLEQAAFKAQGQSKGLTKTGKRRGRPPKKTKELLSPVVKTAFEGETETVLTTETEAKSEGNVSTSTDHLSTTTTSQKGETKQTDSLAVKPKVQGKKTGKRGRKPGGARGNVNPSGKKASVASALQETVASRPGDGLSVADPAPVQSEMITTTKGSQGLDDESSSLKQDDNQSTPPIRIENVRTLPTHATGDSVTEMDNIIKILRTPKQKKSEVSIGRGFSRVKALFTVDPQEQPPPESGDALSEEERIVSKETHEFSQTVPKATLPKTIVFEKPFSHTESSKEVFFPLTKEEFFPIPSSHHLGLARRPQQTIKTVSMPHTDQMTTHKKGPMQTIGKPQQEKQRRLKDWTQTTTGPILQTKQKPHLHTSKHPSSPVAMQSPKTFMESPQLVTQKPQSHKRPSQQVYQPPSMTMSRPELLGSASNTHSTTGPSMVQRPGLHVPAKSFAKLSATPNPPPASAYSVNPKSQAGAIVPSKEMLRSPNSAFTALKKSNPVVDQQIESTRIDLTGDRTSTVVSVAQTAQVNKQGVYSGSASQTIPKSDVSGQGAKTTPVNERGHPNVAPSSTAASSASQDKGMAAHLRKEMATFRMTISGHVRAEVNENPSSLVKVLALYRGLSSQSKEKVLLTDKEISSLAEIKTDVFSTPTAFLECVIRQIAVHFPSCVKSCSDHMTLLWGDIELVQEDEREYLLYTGKSSKSPAVLATYIPPRARDRKAYPKPDSPGQCPVTIYKQYLQMRRPESNIPEAPFYLMPTRDFSDAFQTRGLEDKSFSLLAALILGKAKKALNPENVVEILD